MVTAWFMCSNDFKWAYLEHIAVEFPEQNSTEQVGGQTGAII